MEGLGWPGSAGAGRRMRSVARVAAGGACAGLVLIDVAAPFGTIAGHMAEHILLMNVLAPALAALAIARRAGLAAPGKALAAATLAQLALLWGWHAPAALSLAFRRWDAHALMHVSLLAAALCFWLAILSAKGAPGWRSLLALLPTSKLFCLLGALLVLAPRPIYADLIGAGAVDLEAMMADQRLAGLMMLIACPLTYVTAGVTIAASRLRDSAAPATELSRLSLSAS